MQLTEVKDKAGEKQFLQVASVLYRNDPNYIRPLDKDISDVFDPGKNKAFRFGKACRWILHDEKGNLLGRIAAFVNKKYKNKGDTVPVGCIGFFECINNQRAAALLFDRAKSWLAENGMQAMDGPVNFGERDRWWGLVIKGFGEPLYAMNYNPPHYVDLFEQYGFRIFYRQLCFGMDPLKPLSEKIHQRHAAIAADPDYHSEHFRKNQLEKYAADFTTVYNKAWAGHGGNKQMPLEQARLLFKKMRPILDEKIIWFAYHRNEPIAMFVNLPDLNEWFRHLDGKFGLLQKIRFLLLQRFKPNRKCTGLAFGIVPEYQGKGVDAYIVGEAAKHMQSPASPYTSYEIQWIGEFNPKMVNIARNLGESFISRELATYRCFFDSSIPVTPHPTL
jgi:GNAT superfamily N-acetyltransferase